MDENMLNYLLALCEDITQTLKKFNDLKNEKNDKF